MLCNAIGIHGTSDRIHRRGTLLLLALIQGLLARMMLEIMYPYFVAIRRTLRDDLVS